MINKDDGKRVLTFMREQLGFKVPRAGLLAGQSICSVLLYLKGLSDKVEINDVDVFLPSERNQREWNFYAQTFAKKIALPYANIKSFDNFIPFDKFPDINQLIKAKNRKDNEIASFRSIILSEKDDPGCEYFGDYLHNVKYQKKKLISFSSYSANNGYSITGVNRSGILNYVYVNSRMKDFLTPHPYEILHYFDLNAVQVAIDLRTEEIYYTHYFEHFLHSKQLLILRTDRPYHTMVRYFQKREQHGYYGNDELAVKMCNTYIKLGNLKEDDMLISLESSDDRIEEIVKRYAFKISEFGEGYQKKFNKIKMISSYYRLLSRQTKINYKDKTILTNESPEKYNLYRLKPKDGGIDFILDGTHRKLMEKTFRLPIENYPNYARAAVPMLAHEYYGSFKQKYSQKRLDTISSINKKTKSYDLNSLNEALYAQADYYKGNLTLSHQKIIDDFMSKHRVNRHFLHLLGEEKFKIIKKLSTLEKQRPELINMIEHIAFIDFNKIGIDNLEGYFELEYKKYQEKLTKRNQFKQSVDFESRVINDIEIIELFTQDQLNDESSVLKHCVNGYGERIRKRISYILSFRKSINNRATLELCFNKDSKKWRMVQFRGLRNTNPDQQMHDALDIFMKKINESLI